MVITSFLKSTLHAIVWVPAPLKPDLTLAITLDWFRYPMVFLQMYSVIPLLAH